jgi:histidinol-phosphatase (PHP family)
MMDMARAAESKGLSEICFTDHIDFDFPNGEYMVDFDEYLRQFEETVIAFPSIKIRKGIEAGIEPQSFNRYEELFRGQRLDYIIGSVHVVFGYDPYFPALWNDFSQKEAFDEYARLSLRCLEAIDVFDVLGHLGYIGKYCPYVDKLFRYSDYTDIVDTILKKLVAASKGLEVNTSGLAKIGDFLPEKSIIERYFELGGEMITIGSDAHNLGSVGFAADETLQYLKHTGFKYVCAFDQRKPRFIPIP